MDIISFINSRDVAEYLRKTDYKFSPEEAMFVVHGGRNIPVAKKHRAYEELIARYPDYRLTERRDGLFKNQTLAEFLRVYMKRETELIAECKREGDDAIYSYAYYNKNDGWVYPKSFDPIFHTFRECFDDAFGDENAEYTEKIIIIKKYIGKNQSIELELLSDGTALGLDTFNIDDGIVSAFDWMWVNIPTPFKRGDIIIPCTEKIWDGHRHEEGEGVFVLSELFTWGSAELVENGYKNSKLHGDNDRDFAHADKLLSLFSDTGDTSDMRAAGYFIASDGTVIREHTHGLETYLDYEYYRGEFKGKMRMLKAVSNYVKGLIPIELLLRAYQITLTEHNFAEAKVGLDWFDSDALELAGLQSEDDII